MNVSYLVFTVTRRFVEIFTANIVTYWNCPRSEARFQNIATFLWWFVDVVFHA